MFLFIFILFYFIELIFNLIHSSGSHHYLVSIKIAVVLPHLVVNWILCPFSVNSQVVHITRIGHLLDVDPEWPVIASVKLDDPVFDHVLQVSKTTPDVPLVLHGVRSGPRIPVPVKGHKGEVKKVVGSSRGDFKLIQAGDLSYLAVLLYEIYSIMVLI